MPNNRVVWASQGSKFLYDCSIAADILIVSVAEFDLRPFTERGDNQGEKPKRHKQEVCGASI
jgi:hypothetical protein